MATGIRKRRSKKLVSFPDASALGLLYYCLSNYLSLYTCLWQAPLYNLFMEREENFHEFRVKESLRHPSWLKKAARFLILVFLAGHCLFGISMVVRRGYEAAADYIAQPSSSKLLTLSFHYLFFHALLLCGIMVFFLYVWLKLYFSLSIRVDGEGIYRITEYGEQYISLDEIERLEVIHGRKNKVAFVKILGTEKEKMTIYSSISGIEDVVSLLEQGIADKAKIIRGGRFFALKSLLPYIASVFLLFSLLFGGQLALFGKFHELGMDNSMNLITILMEFVYSGIIFIIGIAFFKRFPLYGYFGNPFRKFDYVIGGLCFLVSINILVFLALFYLWAL